MHAPLRRTSTTRARLAEPLPDQAAGRPPRVGIGGLLALFLGVVVADVTFRGDSERFEVGAEEICARSGDGGSKYAGRRKFCIAMSPML
jgi:hypothetical protein